MITEGQNEDEIIILSDETDFLGGLEMDKEKETKKGEVEVEKEESILKLPMEEVVDETSKDKKENKSLQNNSLDSGMFSFDSPLDNDKGSNSSKKEKSGYDLNSIIDGTISDLKIRKEELVGEKNDTIDEKEFRDGEIKRLKDEIHDLNVDKSKLEAEIKKIDENTISLGKMKIGSHTVRSTTKK